VKAFATFRDLLGRGRIHVELSENSSILDLILKLDEMLNKGLANRLLRDRKLDPNVMILLNGREIKHLNGLNTKLKDGDVVAFIPPIAGG